VRKRKKKRKEKKRKRKKGGENKRSEDTIFVFSPEVRVRAFSYMRVRNIVGKPRKLGLVKQTK
jgi:hypothetical protein